MSTYHTEEEQLDNLKRFWKVYGTKIIAVVVIITAVSGGWFYYQERQNAYFENGAVEYHKLLEMMESTTAAKPEEVQKIQAQSQLLRDKYAKTPYAAASALLIAKQAVDQGNLPEAKAQLEWVSLNSKEGDFTQLAHARMARILLSEKNYEAALKELDAEAGHRYDSEYQEIRGDILYSMQKPAEARAAYELALKNMPNSPEKMLIQMKYDDLASPNDILWSPDTEQNETKEKKQ